MRGFLHSLLFPALLWVFWAQICIISQFRETIKTKLLKNKRKGSSLCLTFSMECSFVPSLLAVVTVTGVVGLFCMHHNAASWTWAACWSCQLPLQSWMGGVWSPSQGIFISLDGNQRMWENETLQVFKFPDCDASECSITYNTQSKRGGKWTHTLGAAATSVPLSFPLSLARWHFLA